MHGPNKRHPRVRVVLASSARAYVEIHVAQRSRVMIEMVLRPFVIGKDDFAPSLIFDERLFTRFGHWCGFQNTVAVIFCHDVLPAASAQRTSSSF